MLTILSTLSLLFAVLIFSYAASNWKVRKRMRKLEKARNEREKQLVAHEQRKTTLSIPGYYENIVGNNKIKKTYKWELHDSI